MYFTEYSLELFYESLYKDEYLVIGVLDDDQVLSNLFKARVLNSLSKIKYPINIKFINKNDVDFVLDNYLVFPQLLIYRNDKLKRTLYGFVGREKMDYFLNKSIKK